MPRRLGLAHAGGTGEEEGTNGLVRRFQTRTGELDSRGQGFDGQILTEDGQLEVPLQVAQQFLVGAIDGLGRNPRDLGDDVFNLLNIDARGTTLFGLQTLVGTRLVDDVDGLVGHVPVVDVAGGELRRGTQRFIGVLDVVVLLEAPLEAPQDAIGVIHRGLDHVDLLETSGQRPILLEDAAEFLEGSRAYATDLTGGQQRLEQVGGIHHPA